MEATGPPIDLGGFLSPAIVSPSTSSFLFLDDPQVESIRQLKRQSTGGAFVGQRPTNLPIASSSETPARTSRSARSATMAKSVLHCHCRMCRLSVLHPPKVPLFAQASTVRWHVQRVCMPGPGGEKKIYGGSIHARDCRN